MWKFAIFLIAVTFTLSFNGAAWATNGHQMIGVGAYQKGMAGAVTAAPGSTATAISNPAGMALIGTKADFSFEGFMPTRSVDFTASGGQKTEGGSDLYLVPAVGWVGPVDGRDDLYFGGGMFWLAGMGVDYDTIDSIPFNAQMGDFTPWKANLFTQYQFAKLAPTLAKKINDRLSVGVSLNIDYQQLSFKQKYTNPGNPAQYVGADLSKPEGALGFGATFGVIYKVNDLVQVGATYITEQAFQNMEYRLSQGDIVFPDGRGNAFVNSDGTYKWKMNFPQQFAMGAAITPNDRLKVTADVKWINFSATHDDQQSLDGNFALVSMATGQPVGQAGSMPLQFGWDDMWVFAVAAEYVFTPMVTARVGYNHGDSPIGEEDVFNNAAFPAIVEDHFTAGVDVSLGDHWMVGLAGMIASENKLTGVNDLGPGQSSGTTVSLKQTSLLLSITHNFSNK